MNSPKPFSISHTRLQTFRRCLQQYHWKYVNHYFPKSSVGQSRGSAGHAALADWHLNYNPQSAMQAGWDKWYADGLGFNSDWQQIEDALNRYFAWSRNNDNFRIIDSEYKFDIEYELPDGELVTFTGYIDGFIEENNQLWILENKFWKKVDTSGLEVDAQVTMYMLAASILKKPVHGVLYNIVRIGDGPKCLSEPVVRKRLHRNADGLYHVQEEMLIQARTMIAYEQKGGIPYRNATKDCSWDCSFYGPCLGLLDDGNVDTQQLESLCYITKQEEISNGKEETATGG